MPSIASSPLVTRSAIASRNAACVRGVLNLRGRVVPVVDLAVRFGRPESEPTRRTCVVIVEVQNEEEQMDIGLIVDGVNQVIEIPAADIEPPPTFGARLRTDFISGMGKVNGAFVVGHYYVKEIVPT